MMRNLPAQLVAALRAMIAFSVVLGIVYPLAVYGVGQVVMHANANGSLIKNNGVVVGSDLIGQSFADDKGHALPQFFQSRPSNAGDGYDPTSTAASNRGPEDVTDTPDRVSLLTDVCTRSADIGKADGVSGARPFCANDGKGSPTSRGTAGVTGAVPADAVTASGSGLDPDISPAYARLQVARVASARSLPVARVQALVDSHVQGRVLGFLGEARVNVLELNLALGKLSTP